MPKRTKRLPYQRQGHEPRVFDLRSELYRLFGVDLTNVPGISAMTSQTILCEVGTDVSRFRNASAFASWLGLCPEKKISGGKVLFTKSRRVRSRVAIPLRLAASVLTPCQRLHGRLLPQDLSQARQASGYHCYCSQARSNRLPPAQHPRPMTNRCSTSAKRRH